MVNASINFSPNRQCRSCRFNARSPYLVCAVHPVGPDQRRCPDFESVTPVAQSSGSSASLRPLIVEPDWMRFWGPTDDEWLAFWEPEDWEDHCG